VKPVFGELRPIEFEVRFIGRDLSGLESRLMSPSEVVSSLSVSFESFPFPFISEKTGQFLLELESNFCDHFGTEIK
jgi:hypothetical protein